MRPLLLLALLAPLAARAHYFAFDFVSPSGVGSRTDGGFSAIQWIDSPDPNGLASFTFYASRTGLAPFLIAAMDVQIGPMMIPLNEPTNLVQWNAAGVAPGCYQPFAVMVDKIEGTTVRPCAGLITVEPADGGNRPPAIWVLNSEFEKPALDGGAFAVRLKIEDPDDVGEVTLRWSDGADAGGVLASGLPTPDGGGTLTYSLNPRALPPATAYFLHAEVTGFDGQRCAVWWKGYLPGIGGPDAGQDAGSDAGAPDAGNTPSAPRGCGCGQPGAEPLLALAVALGARPRRGARSKLW